MLTLAEQMFYALFPGQCVICKGNSRHRIDLCLGCQRDLPYENEGCWQCGLALASRSDSCRNCQSQPPVYSHCFPLLRYQHPADFLISEFKNRRGLALGSVLSMLLAHRYIKLHHTMPDYWVPVPLHRTAYRKRGFNQAAEICSVMGKLTNTPVLLRGISKTRQTQPQKQLSTTERKQNVRDAFSIKPDLTGKNIAIVDDVVTTGATVSELSKTILDAGASDVHIVCLARTPEN